MVQLNSNWLLSGEQVFLIALSKYKGNSNSSDHLDMISINVIDRQGQSHTIEAPVDMGLTLMEVCKANDLPVEGTCGGMALCASCHVYILSDHQLSDRSDAEEEMLDQAFFVDESSRLGCQVRIAEELDGLVVKLAPV